MGPTTIALHPPQLQRLHSKEATSKPFPSKPQHLPPHSQNGRLRQLQLLLLELLLRSGLLHLRQISKSFHQPTFGSIIRRHHHITASPRRSSIVFVWGTCERNAAVFARHSGLLAGVNRRAD